MVNRIIAISSTVITVTWLWLLYVTRSMSGV